MKEVSGNVPVDHTNGIRVKGDEMCVATMLPLEYLFNFVGGGESVDFLFIDYWLRHNLNGIKFLVETMTHVPMGVGLYLLSPS
jgi:hypothetical protein